jgi:hypothetical protein
VLRKVVILNRTAIPLCICMCFVCHAVLLDECLLVFQRNILPASSRVESLILLGLFIP